VLRSHGAAPRQGKPLVAMQMKLRNPGCQHTMGRRCAARTVRHINKVSSPGPHLDASHVKG